MAEKEEKLSKKEMDAIAFRDSVTKKLKNLESKEKMREKAKAAKAAEVEKKRRRNKRKMTLRCQKGFL